MSTTDTIVRPPPSWLISAARAAPSRPVPLRGTAKQVAWAESIRRDRITYARARAGPPIVAVLGIIEDSTWWIANRDTPLVDLDWPSPDQIAASVRQPTICPHCGRSLASPATDRGDIPF